MKELTHDGLRILVGKDVKDNMSLLKSYNNTDYIFVHLKSFSSPHVVIMSNNPTDDTIQFASQACKQESKYRYIKGVKAIYTSYSNVRKTDVPGTVVFKSNRKVKDIVITKVLD